MTDQGMYPPPQSGPLPGSPEQPDRSNKGLVITLIALVVAIVVALVALLIVLFTGSDDDDSDADPTASPSPTETTAGPSPQPTPTPTDPNPSPGPEPGPDEQVLLDLTAEYLDARIADDCSAIAAYVTDEFLDRHSCAGGSELNSTTELLTEHTMYDEQLAMSDQYGSSENDTQYSFFIDFYGECAEIELVYPFEEVDGEFLITTEYFLLFDPETDASNCR